MIQEKTLVTEKLPVENKWGQRKININEVCIFRIDLNCFPNLWSEPLYIEISLMIMVDKECRQSKRFEIYENSYAVIEKQTLRLNDPLSSSETIDIQYTASILKHHLIIYFMLT